MADFNISDLLDDTIADAGQIMFRNPSAGATVKHKKATFDDLVTYLSTELASTFVATGDTAYLAPSGTINPFAGTAAPTGWLACDDSAVSRTTYATLFTAIGETWGVGNGSTTFNLPDLRGVFLRGAGTAGTLTDAAGDKFAGGAVGATANDKFQGHWHDMGYEALSEGTGGTFFSAHSDTDGTNGNKPIKDPSTDTVNGTPRTGAETQPVNASVLYIIKT